MKWIRACLAALAAACIAAAAAAQGFPAKPVTIVVPYPPGGPPDAVARVLAQELSRQLGQPVVIDNRGGANGDIGRRFAEVAPQDGYTLLVDRASFVTGRLVGVQELAATPYLLVANPSRGWRSVADLVRAARASPGKFSFSVPGNGTEHHRLTLRFQHAASLEVTVIPFRGMAPAMHELISGNIDAAFAEPAAVWSHVQAGKLVALASTGIRRSSLRSQIPTLGEQNVPNLTGSSTYVLYAPEGTPPPVLARLRNGARLALSAPDAKSALERAGFEYGPNEEGAAGDPVCDAGKKYCRCKKQCIPSTDTCSC